MGPIPATRGGSQLQTGTHLSPAPPHNYYFFLRVSVYFKLPTQTEKIMALELRFVLRYEQPKHLGPEFQEEVRVLQYRDYQLIDGEYSATEWQDVPLVDLRE